MKVAGLLSSALCLTLFGGSASVLAVPQAQTAPAAAEAEPDVDPEEQARRERQQKLRELRTHYLEDTRPLRDQVKEKTREINRLFRTEPVDRDQILALAKDVRDLRGKLYMKEIELRFATEPLLPRRPAPVVGAQSAPQSAPQTQP